jgi:hypothetical protein
MGVLVVNWLEYLAGYVGGDSYLYRYKRDRKYFVRIADKGESSLLLFSLPGPKPREGDYRYIKIMGVLVVSWLEYLAGYV